MVTHDHARTVLALLGCNWVVLDTVFVHWPLQQGQLAYPTLDGQWHCLWEATVRTDVNWLYQQYWYQQGVLHRTGGPAFELCFDSYPLQIEWWERGVQVNQPDSL